MPACKKCVIGTVIADGVWVKSERDEMKREQCESITAAELFGTTEKDAGLVSGPAKRGKKGGAKASSFDDIKARMVMRIYGVSRAKALEIIAERAKRAADESSDPSSAEARRSRYANGGGMMSAEEFFQGC